ncbi:hypothetical protein [Kitasatospora sp. DSM 101779]|uniref:hypothetical protein n=1 Tax=Kitasatospora sp. DSM 101779 TaxID=2853165 RepID=UPI0021DB155F|nr:hypothetical protein [Kitasatospora sp. DSM 101779]MCU7826572.1 hypothetical protein [Kitasatospora sp. DSM 101779]
MAPEGDDDAESRGEEGGDRPDRSPAPHVPGPADHVWIAVLVLIVVVLVLVFLLSDVNLDTGGGVGGFD